jgi:hypothetical protein
MATAVQVAGLTTVSVGSGSGGALETLGYSRNGVTVRKDGHWLNVPGDANGGDDGPPIEIQFLGETAIVRLELTKFDSAVLTKIAARLRGSTEGTVPTSGTLVFANSYGFRLLLNNASDVINFLVAVPRGAYEKNRGTKYQTAVLEFECHKNASDVLHNASAA